MKNLKSIAFFMLFVNILNAQIKTNVFTLDLSNPKIESLTSTHSNNKRLSFWSREPLQFELVNGNPFRYKYVINNKVINFFEDQSNNPITNIEKLLNNGASVVTTEIPNDKKEAEKTKLILQIKNKEELLKQSNDTGGNKNLNLEQTELKKLKNELITLEQNTYKAKAGASYFYLMNFGIDVQYPINEEEDQIIIVEALSVLKPKIEELLYKITNDEIVFRSDDDFNFEKFKLSRENYNQNFQEQLQYYFKIKSDIKKFSNLILALKSKQSESEETITQLNDKIALFYSIRRDNFTMPIDVNGKNIDVVEITVKRFENNTLIPEEFNYNLWVKGGFKIDISGGVYITSLVDKEYFTAIKTQDINGIPITGKVIFEKEKGNYDFGFGSSINISHRSAGWINPTLNVGALFTANQKFQLLTGVGLILGKQERIIFSGGLAMGRIDTLAQNMNADGTTIYDIGEGGQVPTESTFEFGGYFGITYNFTKTKKQIPNVQ
jgi:hypothetical protein